MRPIVGGALPASPVPHRPVTVLRLVSSDAAVASEPRRRLDPGPGHVVDRHRGGGRRVPPPVARVAARAGLRHGRGLHARLPRPRLARRGSQQGLPLPLRPRKPLVTCRRLQGVRYASARRTARGTHTTRRDGGGRRAPRAVVGAVGRGRGGPAQRDVRDARVATHRHPVDGRRRARARRTGRAVAGARRCGSRQRPSLGLRRRAPRGFRNPVPHRCRRSRSHWAARRRCGPSRAR